MSGIFKGDSIYKSGGGGGGYKDGGQLTPAQYITVPNNVIVQYDNSDPEINFIIEDDGKPHNSIIEVSTSVNAIVNVYEVKNGFYYLMGIVGPNTVVAGQDYTVNIIGNSYVIENVTQQSSDPKAAEIAGEIVPVLKVNNILWACADLGETEFSHRKIDGICYYTLNKNIVVNGWRIPTLNELIALNSNYNWQQLRSTSGWPGGYNGNNTSGFNAYPNGRILYGGLNGKGTESWLTVVYNGSAKGAYMSYSDNYQYTFDADGLPVRLVYDL